MDKDSEATNVSGETDVCRNRGKIKSEEQEKHE